jgi:hypothetical protein
MTETVMGRRYHAWDVYTDKERWQVITPPTNLYRQKDFPSLDYMITPQRERRTNRSDGIRPG